MLWQIQDVPCLQNDLVRSCLCEHGELFDIWVVPVHLRMTCRWVTLGVQIEILAVLWMTQDISPSSSQHDNIVS